jgi:hypothetical protein
MARMQVCSVCGIDKKHSEINKETSICFECEYRKWCKIILGEKSSGE